MKRNAIKITLLFAVILIVSCAKEETVIKGELKKWHTLTFTFEGPELDESSVPNPFLDYRLQVEFINGDTKYSVPGFLPLMGMQQKQMRPVAINGK